MNPITSYATMLRHEPHRGQLVSTGAAPNANDDAQVAAILTSLSTIAEKEFSSDSTGRIVPRQPNKKHQHPLLDSKPSIKSIKSDISLDAYLQSCRLNKMHQRARAVSIEYTGGTANSDASYMLSPQPTEAIESLESGVSPLSMPSALVTPSSSPVLGSRVVVRTKISTAFPRVIHLSPKAIADSAAHTNGVRTAMLSAGFERSTQIPSLYPTAGKTKSRQYMKSMSSTKVIAKKKQPKNIVPARDGSKKMLIMKRFCWRDFPELENILISNRREYLSFSSRNYSPAQKKFNNNLTATIIKTAEDCGYKFCPKTFDFSAVRDRIRCFYKSYVQGEKKRLFAALAVATSAEERRTLQKEIAFLDSRSSGTRKS